MLGGGRIRIAARRGGRAALRRCYHDNTTIRWTPWRTYKHGAAAAAYITWISILPSQAAPEQY